MDYFFLDKSMCVPFIRGTGISMTGPRIGGGAPEGVLPQKRLQESIYLVTLPLTKDRELEFSVFFNGPLFRSFVDVPSNEIVPPTNQAIEISVHKRSRRGDGSLFASDLTEQPLIRATKTRF